VAGRRKLTFGLAPGHLLERGLPTFLSADNVSIIGCDAANGTYHQLYSDERGVCRV
jgi:hypothetical protein